MAYVIALKRKKKVWRSDEVAEGPIQPEGEDREKITRLPATVTRWQANSSGAVAAADGNADNATDATSEAAAQKVTFKPRLVVHGPASENSTEALNRYRNK